MLPLPLGPYSLPPRALRQDSLAFTTFVTHSRARAAYELLAEIHDRMPLILAPTDYVRWLSDEPDPHDLMRPFPAQPIRMDDAELAHSARCVSGREAGDYLAMASLWLQGVLALEIPKQGRARSSRQGNRELLAGGPRRVRKEVPGPTNR
jgi:hypothetical protein